MAQKSAQAAQFSPAIVKAVFSGDTLVLMRSTLPGAMEKTITLSNIWAPKLARKGGDDDAFAWDSREFLRKLCIGKNVYFRVDHTDSASGRQFGTVVINDKNLAELTVSEGWAKVKFKTENQKNGEKNPCLETLKHAQDLAKEQELGQWTRDADAQERARRDLPPSAVGAPGFDAIDFIASNKGRPIEAIVEYVRDGTTVRVYLLPYFEKVQVYVAGIQAPSMASLRRVDSNASVDTTSSASSAEGSPNPIAREAKHFTEMHLLNRDVCVVLEGADKYNNLIGSIYYTEGESSTNLAMELVKNGLAKYAEWSASLVEEDVKKNLKSAEFEAKNKQLKMWKGFVEKPISEQKFTGKVIEIGNRDWIVVTDDADPTAERRVHLSSISCPKMGDSRKNESPQDYAYEARELLRKCLIGKQVNVSMEYNRNIRFGKESRVVNCGSVFLENDDTTTNRTTNNVAEILVSRGYAFVVKHRDSDDRSNHYADLVAAEARAIAGKKGMHSEKAYSPQHIADRTEDSQKDAKTFLPFLQKNKMSAIVEHIFSGHRFKLYVPQESSYISFSLSGVRCPGREEPYSREAISFMRRRILNRDVEIEVETVDNRGTFLGSLMISGTNIAITLVQAGLANVFAYNIEKITNGNLLVMAQQSAMKNKLKIWENFTGEKVANGPVVRSRTKQEMKVKVTDILDGGTFYVQAIDNTLSSIEERLSSLNLDEASKEDTTYTPKKGDMVISLFHGDNQWYRAMVVKVFTNNRYEVFYIDYGNQETVSLTDLRPINPSVPSGPGLAKLCKLAHIKVPNLNEEYGKEAAIWLDEQTLNREFRAIIEGKDNSAGSRGMGRGTGIVLEVTLIEDSTKGDDESVNAAMLEVGLARLKRNRGPRSKEIREAMKTLEPYQLYARNERLGMWVYGDVASDGDDDDKDRPVKAAGKKQ